MATPSMELDHGSLCKTFHGIKGRVDQSRNEIIRKWSGNGGARRSYPKACSFLEVAVEKALKTHCKGKVCEIGCGTGRIAKHFPSSRYLGLDINDYALERAEKRHPEHEFELIFWDTIYPSADTYLFFTVLMHIPDDELGGILKRLDKRVVVVESMGEWLRDYGRDNNYQRDPSTYRGIFKKYGFHEEAFVHCLAFHYPYYLDIMVFETV